MTTHVVAGATGRVGSVVARDVLARGGRVRVIVRDESSAASWRSAGAEAATGSLDDGDFLTAALRGAAAFFAMLPENVPPAEFYAARHRMADTIADSVTRSGVPRVVLLSAIAAVLADGNGPAKPLHYLETRLRATGATVTTLRPCYYQDNIASVLPASTIQGVYPTLSPVDAALPMVATKDVGHFAAAALVDPRAIREIVDIMGPAYSARQLASALGTAMGRPLQIVEIPPAGHMAALTQAGLPPQIAEAVAEMLGAFAAGRIAPQGDRTVVGATPIEQVIAAILTSSGLASV